MISVPNGKWKKGPQFPISEVTLPLVHTTNDATVPTSCIVVKKTYPFSQNYYASLCQKSVQNYFLFCYDFILNVCSKVLQELAYSFVIYRIEKIR